MSTGETWTLGRRPALDGLRGLAVLLVLVHHSATVLDLPSAGGVVGVTAFFTLSGFLITALLLDELDRSGRISLAAFYLRRARRLLPALVAFVVVMVAGGLVLPQLAPSRAVAPVLLYVGNWSAALSADGRVLGGLTHTWSLAIEEQFYLVYPVALLLVVARFGRRALVAAALAGAAGSMLLRLTLWDDGAGMWRVYFGSDTRADALLIGCALAAVMHGRKDQRARPALAAVLAGGLVLLVATPGLFAQYVVAPTLAAMLTAGVVSAAACGRYSGPLASRPLTWLGRRSYALYLWHFPLFFFVLPVLGLPLVPGLALALAASCLLAVASWRFVEEPFLRSSRRVERDPFERVEDVAASVGDHIPRRVDRAVSVDETAA